MINERRAGIVLVTVFDSVFTFISKFNIGKFSVSLALVIMEYTLIALLLKLKKKIIIAEH